MKLAFFGGIYNNYLALEAAIRDARDRGADELYCLGDLGAFGPHPDRVFPLLFEHHVTCLQGNYDDSVANDRADCQCGYTDPRDNYFAQISYDYTYAHTSAEHRLWMRSLPKERRMVVDGLRILLCHGSPRRTNEFLWESTTSTQFLDKLSRDHDADLILGTHTGIPWERRLSCGRWFANVGVLGRPANDGRTEVCYAFLRTGPDAFSKAAMPKSAIGCRAGQVSAASFDLDFVPVVYDHERLAAEMREERLPEEFVETILTGWWTTCLEVLPAKERRRGRY